MTRKTVFLSPSRPDMLMEELSGGAYHGWPKEARPHIQSKHIDGPLLYFRNGEIHWLTLWERFLVWIGAENAFTLEQKHRPHLQEPVCTCHPDEAPRPCQRRFAYSECLAAAHGRTWNATTPG